jgi:hypothetical protein
MYGLSFLDDITCSLCQGVNVTVSCHSIFIPKFHTKTWCSTNRGSEKDKVLCKKNMDGTNARLQHVWTLMVGITKLFWKTMFKHNYLYPVISSLCVLYNINQYALWSEQWRTEGEVWGVIPPPRQWIYSCLQNPLTRGPLPSDSRSLRPQLNLFNPPNKIPGSASGSDHIHL